MKPNFRTCPQCSTRNRLDKEYCVKCGEPLEGIKAGDPTLVMKKGKPGFFVAGEGDEAKSPLIPLVVLVLTLGVGLLAWRALQQETTAAPAEALPAPQRQASLPAPVQVEMTPGVRDYTAGMAALRAGDFTQAVRLLRLAVAAASGNADYRLGLAEALEKSGSTTQSLSEYEAAANSAGGNPRYASEWAKALNRAGRNTEAIRAYEAALQIDPQNLSNLRELANLHVKSNDFTKARPYLERIVELQPDDLAPKQSLARALEAARDLPAAARQYRDILAARPQSDLTRALLSDVLMRQDRGAEALALLDEGIRLDAGAGVLYREKGRIFDRQGRNADAVAAYREYIRLSPGATDIQVFTQRIGQLQSPTD